MIGQTMRFLLTADLRRITRVGDDFDIFEPRRYATYVYRENGLFGRAKAFFGLPIRVRVVVTVFRT